MRKNAVLPILLILFTHCTSTDYSEKKASNTDKEIASKASKPLKPLFSRLNPAKTGIAFNNTLFENEFFNNFSYEYFYNGGGVAAGDFDNDGLVDLFFTGNQVSNRLYKNLGNWKFRDVTNQANVASKNTWSTGASFIDINADGLLDIYVCRAFTSGYEDWHKNLLYINNGNSTFTESAKKYGLDDAGYSIQASFFDYDLDGDLDVYVANHPKEFHESMGLRNDKWKSPNLKESNHLYRNNGDDTFTDVTKQSGLLSYDFSLGIITADINGDAYPDIYVSNDYEFPDQYYLNNGDGTFRESSKKAFKHTSHFAMGVDYSDINNDSLADIVTVDMVAADNYRQKTMMPSMSIENFWIFVNFGYNYQYMKNSIQLNQGFGIFSEIGQLSGISKTDWSWAVLLADFNLDGWKDMFVTNGYYRDTRNVDFSNQFKEKFGINGIITNELITEVLPMIPQQKINNFYFENQKDLRFEDRSVKSGIDLPSFSNGATYADLDNDGDLDLVINNIGDPAHIYRNQSIENNSGNYLIVKLQGEGKNINGIGSNITIRSGNNIQNRQHIITRGYQSGVSNQIHFGLGAENNIEELEIKWPSGKSERIKNVKANQVLILKEINAGGSISYPQISTTALFKSPIDNFGITYTSTENYFDDFKREILLPHKMSQLGPKICVGDVNGDQLDDIFIGGAAASTGSLYIQRSDGSFNKSSQSVWDKDFGSEDIGGAFFDSDNDGDLDLYVVSGGNEFKEGSSLYKDRLYLNDGFGNFKKSEGKIPTILTSGSCVVPADYDKDGDLDLFIGGRQTPGKYPYPANSSILQNNDGVFTDVTKEVCPQLEQIGMVTTAVWSDFDGDDDLDLILAGEWMNIRFFENLDGKFNEATNRLGLDSTTGWWNKIVECDLNKDGLMDYVVGNLGENYKFKASKEVPFRIYANDFDKNGTQDIVLGYDYKGEYFPVRGRECSSQQMPDIKKRFPSYHDYGQAKLIDIYGDKLEQSLHYEAFQFSSVILKNTGNGFEVQALPVEAQFSAIQGIVVHDFTKDGIDDILLAGNFFVAEIETGRADAGKGLFLRGEGDFNYTPLTAKDCGFYAPGDVRDLQLFYNSQKEACVIVANNNARVQLFTTHK